MCRAGVDHPLLFNPAERVGPMLERLCGSQLFINEDNDGDVLRVRHQPRFHLVPLVLKTPEHSRRVVDLEGGHLSGSA